jgi:putative glutamine amidotransferase
MAPRSYSSAVEATGSLALLVPPPRDAPGPAVDAVLERIDALILAGGSDVDPSSYGAARDPETNGTCPERDRFELELTRRAVEDGTPVLGICRGMQILNVALGGTLVQHLPDVVGHNDHRHTPGAFADHEVRLLEGSLAEQAAGGERVTVKSHHHQGVGELGEGLVVTGWADADDLIEAIELRGHPFALGVLWHPEEDERSRVVEALVAAARTGVATR